MRTNMKGPAAALLAAVLLLGLTASSEKKEVHKVNWVTAPAYLAEDVALPVETGELLGSCTDGEYMYVLADTKTGEEVTTHLLRASLADGEAAELDGFEATVVPDGGFKNTMGPFLAPDGTLWLYEMWSISYYDLPEDFDEAVEAKGKYFDRREDFHHLRQLDPGTGRQKKLLDLSDAVRTLDVGDIFDVSGVAVDGQGNVYFAGTGGVAVMNGKGDYLFTLEAALPQAGFDGSCGGPLALLPDGTMAVLTVQPGGKRAVRPVDVSARGWGAERYELPTTVDLIYGGTNGFLFYYTSGGSLWAWEPEAEEGRQLLSWAAAALSGSVMCFAPRDKGELAVLTLAQNGPFSDDGYWYKADIRLFMLSPTDETPADGKTRLVYGAIGTNSVLRSRIDRFNRTNDQYCIELRNYAGEGVELFELDRAGREAAVKLLSAEIASGQVPDIWDASLPISLYARKGVMEDLWPWIDSDPEIDREELMSHVLDCASVDGKLYQVFNSFTIETTAARTDVVGDRTSWTLEEMLDYYEAMPEGSSLYGYRSGKTGTLSQLVCQNINRWIDWTTGECRFDSEEFKAVLALCGRMEDDAGEPDLEKWGRMANGIDLREGRQLLMNVRLWSIGDLLCYDAVMGGPQCLTDYEAYLNENNIFATKIDENGNWRDGSALTCRALSMIEAARRNGKLRGWYTLSQDVVFGAMDEGGYASYPGAPTDSGVGSSFVLPGVISYTDLLMGMSASCRNKEGAWAYMRQCLLPGCSDPVMIDGTEYLGNGFPIRREDFERMLEPSWFQRENGEYVLDRDGNRIESPQDVTCVPEYATDADVTMVIFKLAPSELQMERFWNLYNAIDSVYDEDFTLPNIVVEQAQPYFAGDKSLEETADLIQRRVTLYVNENR